MTIHRRVSARRRAPLRRTVRYQPDRPAAPPGQRPAQSLSQRPAQPLAHRPAAPLDDRGAEPLGCGGTEPLGYRGAERLDRRAAGQPVGGRERRPPVRRDPAERTAALLAGRIAMICATVGGAGMPVTIWLALTGASSSALTSVGAIAATAMSTAGIQLRRRW